MSWQSYSLRELGHVVTGATPPTSESRFYGGDIPFVTPAELEQIEPITSSSRTLTLDGAKEVRIIPEGSVLVCCIGSLGKIGISGQSLATNQQINAVIFDQSLVFPRYGYYACRLLKPKLQTMAPATTVPIVSKSKFEALTIPVPPLAEQRRIAEILDRVEALRVKRREAIAQLYTLIDSVFIDFFGDPIGNPKGWKSTVTLGEVSEITSGITKGRKVNGNPTREVPYLAVINVQDKALNLDSVKVIDATEDEISRYKLKKDDLLLTEGGDPDKLGRGTLWNEEIPGCIHQNHVFRVRLTSRDIHPLFLNWLVGSQRGKNYFLRSAKQTTGIASINMTQLRNFPLLTPPLALQHEFARSATSIKQLLATHRASLAELDALFASLQHRAFRGEL